MTNKYFIQIVLIISLFAIAAFSSCKKDSTPSEPVANKTRLTFVIDSLTTVLNSAVEGHQAGQYGNGAKAELKKSIDFATSVKSDTKYTQAQVDATVTILLKDGKTFATFQILDVSPENLIAFWKFDGDVKDVSGNKHDGTLKTGWIGTTAATATDGGTLPVLTTDRYGVSNKAYGFDKGAYVEVPYNVKLRPSSFTISLWVKRKTTSAGNYMISLNRWLGWKFQLQTSDFLYLTVNTDKGYVDLDDNPGVVPVDTWTMVTASFTNGAMNFYINGALTRKTEPTGGNPIALTTPVNLAIGNELPKSAYDFSPTASDFAFWGANYFVGSLDDIRLYNKALSDAEVNSIYVMEKP